MVEEMAEQQTQPSNEETQAGGAAETNSKGSEYIKELTKEKLALDPALFGNAMKLLDEEIARAQKGKTKDAKSVYDLYRDRPVRASVKIAVPVKDHPKFNFVGKLLGPKGNTLKRLQEETMTKMAVLGRGSMRDKSKEDECRSSLDPKYAHLSDDLHVEIFANGPPAEAHARLAYAMVEIRKYLSPEGGDDVRGGGEMGSGGPLRGRGPGGRGGYRGGMMGPPPPGPPRAAVNASKVMSILDRARMSMDGGYSQYEEGPGGYGYDVFDNGASGYGDFEYGGGGGAAHGLVQYPLPSHAPPSGAMPNEGAPGGRWKGYGPKAVAGGGSRFPPRPAPYNRPPKNEWS